MGWIAFGEKLDAWALLGMALIVPAMFGVGFAPATGSLWVAIAFLAYAALYIPTQLINDALTDEPTPRGVQLSASGDLAGQLVADL